MCVCPALSPQPGSIPSTEYGMYQPRCGLENILMSWGHDGKGQGGPTRVSSPLNRGLKHLDWLYPAPPPIYCGLWACSLFSGVGGLSQLGIWGGCCGSWAACPVWGSSPGPAALPPPPCSPEYMYRVMKFNNFTLPKEVRAGRGSVWDRDCRRVGKHPSVGWHISVPLGLLHGPLPLLLPLAYARGLPAPLHRGGPPHATLGQGAQVRSLGGMGQDRRARPSAAPPEGAAPQHDPPLLPAASSTSTPSRRSCLTCSNSRATTSP